jgi:hypothetical protein
LGRFAEKTLEACLQKDFPGSGPVTVHAEKLGQVTGFFGQFPVAWDKNLIKGDFLPCNIGKH